MTSTDTACDVDPGLIVRDLEPGEIGTLLRVMQAAFAQYVTPDFSYGTERETEDSLRAEQERGERALVVMDGSEPVAVVKHHAEEGTGLLYFGRLGVLPEHRGRGISGLLVRALRERAREQGLRGIACNVVPRHAELARVYEREGMRVIGEVDHRTGRGESIRLLRLEQTWDAAGAGTASCDVVMLGPTDAPELAELMHAAFAEYSSRGDASGAMQESAASLADELSGSVRAMGIRHQGHLVAAAKLTRSRDRALVFSRLCVLPAQRGRGWARALVGEIRELARTEGARAIGCQVRAEEADLIELYRRLGLAVTGEGLQQSLTGRVRLVVQMREKL